MAAERFEALDNGEVDMLFRSVSHTTSREELAAFTDNYFLSGPRIAVNELSGIRGLEDINGHSVGFMAGTTTELALTAAAQYLGIFWEPVAYETMGDACLDFLTGDVEVLVGDWIVLMACTGGDVDLPIVGNLLSEYGRTDRLLGGEPMAAVVALGDEDFRDEVNTVLQEFFDDGTWWAVYDRYFAQEPWSLEQMRAEPAIDR